MKEEFIQFLKYGVVGIVNTLLTFFAFVGLRKAGVGLDASNFLSFAAGMACSFILNKLWTFRSKGQKWHRESLLFLLGAALCWALQWAAFRLLLLVLPEMVAQVCGMAVYTLLNFCYNKLVTFRQKH